MGMASMLLDEGFGSFERCMETVRMLDGDITKARDILSSIMITEAQFRD